MVFHSQIASEQGRFNVDDVIRAITQKLDQKAPPRLWRRPSPRRSSGLAAMGHLKRPNSRKTRQAGSGCTAVTFGRDPPAPACPDAGGDVQKRAAKVGFEWEDPAGAHEKIAEELQEVAEARASGDRQKLAKEWPRSLFRPGQRGSLRRHRSGRGASASDGQVLVPLSLHRSRGGPPPKEPGRDEPPRDGRPLGRGKKQRAPGASRRGLIDITHSSLLQLPG